MKKVCLFCGAKKLHHHGGKRRKCSICQKSFRIQSGRPSSRVTHQYLLDRSTYRRIANKKKISHVAVIKKLMSELKKLPSAFDRAKKIFHQPAAF